ncbi:MAG TPA: hypothetical protein DCZ94_11890 [Lentisphaeria bacterium]|nr:MAG: hypothetical protein A2X48_09510 [Lentisphaerae bacterium GWF2_49_21]HBC87649.1 hypothetical protein [Lentisphaeria bacterium]
METGVIKKLLEERKYETARRTAIEYLEHSGDEGVRNQICLLLNEAYRSLGDLRCARDAVETFNPANTREEVLKKVLMAENSAFYSSEGFYRDSDESRQGYCIDEFVAKYRELSGKHYADACSAARCQEDFELIRHSALIFKADIKKIFPSFPDPVQPPLKTSSTGKTVPITCMLQGRITDDENKPVSGIELVLSMNNSFSIEDYRRTAVNPSCGPQNMVFNGIPEIFTAITDSNGGFEFKDMPVGPYDYLAARTSWRDGRYPVIFLKQDFSLSMENAFLELLLARWESAPAAGGAEKFPAVRAFEGEFIRKICEKEIKNPFYYKFPRQLIGLPVGSHGQGTLAVFTGSSSSRPVPVQLSAGKAWIFAELPEEDELDVCIYEAEKDLGLKYESGLKIDIGNDGTAAVSTGASSFRIPWGSQRKPSPPVISVKCADGIWRGTGRFKVPETLGFSSQTTELIEQGPLFIKLRISYDFGADRRIEYTITFHEGEAYALVHEKSFKMDGASFEFSLREFSGGRGYLHWCAEQNSQHWTTLAPSNRELARLQESIAWWIPKHGFGYAATMEGLESKDYIGVFTIRRGEWQDLDFEKICNGPGDDNRELDWPFPEMIGSTLSMITAHTSKDGDFFFNFNFFNGERQWGILASSFDKNDGPYKELSLVQHKNSSPRLDDFKDWLLDMKDHEERPFVLANADEIHRVMEKIRTPEMSRTWKNMLENIHIGPATALKAVIENDTTEIWRLKQLILHNARLRSKLTLQGRDYGDVYSPVGGRQITPLAEQYDLIAPTGVFTADEERLARSFLMLMGHMYMECDFMNWRYNSRNANFEADRTDIVGTVGICFKGNPDAGRFVEHSTELMKKSLEVYCTPGSGKWYENPACYYMHAAGCRLNLAYHLFRHGISDSSRIERLKDFLRWGILLLTPKCPGDYGTMCRTLNDKEYEAENKVRLIPPVGDHAQLGQRVPEYYLLMSKLYEKKDAEFANFLKWAYFQGGCDGQRKSQYPALLCSVEPEELRKVSEPVQLTSRRLEGFGAIFRENFGKDDEFYLLFKMGPGGYRYHRTEGSIILFADGKPIIYDGGEAGETWRHSTLSFYDTHMPLAAGHIERFASFSNLDFAQGVNPAAIKPGEPVFLSDNCHHSLVEIAKSRFEEKNPINARSMIYVKDEYVVMHDNLRLHGMDIPVYWHLQAVADSHTGILSRGYVFKGRFGTDFQVILPGLDSSTDEITQQPVVEHDGRPLEKCFTMRHLQIRVESPETIGALIRPLSRNRKPVKAVNIENNGEKIGMQVSGDGISDTLFLARDEIIYTDDRISFKGRYGMVLERKDCLSLIIIDGEYIRCNGVCIESHGQQTCVHIRPDGISVEAADPEKVKVEQEAIRH